MLHTNQQAAEEFVITIFVLVAFYMYYTRIKKIQRRSGNSGEHDAIWMFLGYLTGGVHMLMVYAYHVNNSENENVLYFNVFGFIIFILLIFLYELIYTELVRNSELILPK